MRKGKQNKLYTSQKDTGIKLFVDKNQQITIDKLDGKDINILELSNKTNEQLILMKNIVDIEIVIKEEFKNRVIELSLFHNKNEISEKVNNLSLNGLIKCIINKIKDIVKYSDNILKINLIKYSSIIDKDNDFISDLSKAIELDISEKVKKVIKELENKDYFQSSILEMEIAIKLKEKIFSFIHEIKTEENEFSINNK